MRKKLKKPCKRCGKSFIPTGNECKLCEKCIEKSNTKRMLNNRITYDRKAKDKIKEILNKRKQNNEMSNL